MTKYLTTIVPWLTLLGLIGCVLSASTQAREFSAELIVTPSQGGAGTPSGKLRVSDDKVRIETNDFSDGFFLIGSKGLDAYFVRPADRIFMDARRSSRLPQLFVPVDPNDPCRQWQAAAARAGSVGSAEWRCERVGEEIADGRTTVMVRATASDQELFVGWVDPELKFPLKIRMADGVTVAVGGIEETPQPQALFEIPSGFRKFDPEALIKRIKQSDVWVEPPAP
jgi:hypothetical protein